MRCPACGFENPSGMRFCGQCGTALASPASPVEERKLVTVLFADVVGSTRLSHAADPEQVRAQLGRFFDLAQEDIRQYGGTIEKFIGDAVMAVFGLPVVHENDPERAARAAVSLQTRVKPEVERGGLPEIRIGIATGEVVANSQAANRGEFLVTGEVVNLAARLQQHAEPSQILVDERTTVALREAARLRRVPPLAVKGFAAPLAAWELLELGPPGARGVRPTPFVGREQEFALVRDHLRRMLREGQGHLVTILGPAGVGKTRLVQEIRAHADGVRILRGRALPYGSGVPFWALGEAIREECGILMSDPFEDARRKVQDAILRLDVAGAAPALLTVLGFGGDGQELARAVLFSGIRSFFEALAGRTPLLLILEDIHSAEDVTLDYVAYTAEWVHRVPIVQLVLSRRELLERRPKWMEDQQGTTTLSLAPIPGEASRELIRGILDSPVPEPLLELVLARAEGNPLFMEEMLRTLVERAILTKDDGRWVLTVPLSQVSIPDTVHAVIAARIDALPGPEKQLLQSAAIVGKEFWLGAMRFITDENHVEESLQALVAKDVLVHKRRSALLGEEEYSFRHILIRDVAYAMLSKTRRWPKHARCAEWLQQIGGNRQAEYADFIAHHWLQVIALRRDLGLPFDARARDEAIANLLLAGDRAARLYANETALDHYTRALELGPVPPAGLHVLLGRGEVRMLLGQHEPAREDFTALRALAQESGQPRWEAIALDHLGYSYRRQDQIVRALEHLESALALSRAVGDPSLTGRILNHIGFTYYNARKPEEAIRSHEEAHLRLQSCGDLEGVAQSLHGLGENFVFLGRFLEAIRCFAESADVSDRIGNQSLSGENRYMIAQTRHLLGDYAEAEGQVERSIATFAAIGDVWNSSFALGIAARIATSLGQLGSALEYATRGLGLARQIGVSRAAGFNLSALSAVHREMENHRDAWQAARDAVDLARTGEAAAFRLPIWLAGLVLDEAALGRPEAAYLHVEEARRILAEGDSSADPWGANEVTYAEGRVLLALGRPDQALDRAKILAHRAVATNLVHWRVPGMLLMADAMAALGDHAAAARTFWAAAEEAEHRGRTPALWRALAGLAEAQRAVGRSQESMDTAGRAKGIIETVAATVPDERLRARFLESATVRRVLSLAAGNSGEL